MFLRESAGMFNSNASPGAQSTDNLFAKLDEGRKDEMSVANLQYPSNLGVDEQHSWILFEIKETDSAKFTTTRNDQNFLFSTQIFCPRTELFFLNFPVFFYTTVVSVYFQIIRPN